VAVRDRLDVNGSVGPIGNTFFRQDGTRLAVVLPGSRGGWLTIAVSYPVLAMLDLGLDALCLDSVYEGTPTREALREDATAALRAGTAAGAYQQVVLAGKSLGTLAMAELICDGPDLAGAPTIWLTPLLKDGRVAAALERLASPGLIVIGTDDHHHDAGALSALEARGHRVLVLAGAHHGLAIDGDAIRSAEIPRLLVDAVSDYLGQPDA
jgi:pimeloyl-ACP methyl ester carboxylesterase